MPIDLVSQLASAAIRSIGLGLVALVGLWLFRVRSSAARHATWTVVLLGMILQIFFGAAAPTVPLTLLTSEPDIVRTRTRVLVPATQSLPPVPEMRRIPKRIRISSREALTGVYLVVSLLLFGRMAFGYWGLRRILRDAKPIRTVGPGIFESPSLVVPGSVGCFRAKILLPAGWRDWDTAKLRAVLAHERAHIQRKDWLIRVVSRANVCIFWFHPLAWWLERELSRLSEEACDDVVLGEVEGRDEYAAILIDIARAAAAYGGVLNRGLISMAKESNVTRRVNRILNCGFPIPKPFGRLAWVMLFAGSLPVICLFAAVKLVPAHQLTLVLERPGGRPNTVEGLPAPSLERNPSSGLIAQAGVRPAPSLTPSRREDVPVSMCMLIDNSGTMRDKRTRVSAAALALVRASRPNDEVCIIDFNDEAFNDLPSGNDFTSDMKEMEQALTRIDSRGGTAMRDAIRMSIDHLEQKAHNARKVVVVISDGNDTSSTVPTEVLLRTVKNSGVPIYCIGLLNEEDADQAGEARRVLGELADASGGRGYYPKHLADSERIMPGVARDIRTY